MKIDNNILFEMVYDINYNYKYLRYKEIHLLTENNGKISFFFDAYSFTEQKHVRQLYSFNMIQYNNILRNKKLNSL